MIVLQSMLLQRDADNVLLFPAWPKDWDVEFKLHAPQGTIIEGTYRDQELVELNVTPESRREDVIVCLGDASVNAYSIAGYATQSSSRSLPRSLSTRIGTTIETKRNVDNDRDNDAGSG